MACNNILNQHKIWLCIAAHNFDGNAILQSIIAFPVTLKDQTEPVFNQALGAQWLSGRVLDSRPKGRGFEPHRRHCVVSLSKNFNPSLVLVQPRKTRSFITERLLMGRKESNQTNKQINQALKAVHVDFVTDTYIQRISSSL